ncbi:MAG TPA: thioredoxin family protein [Flavobacteriales bacterium]|nr:thioredoxin family protein [Flavobacteriales bacterium]
MLFLITAGQGYSQGIQFEHDSTLAQLKEKAKKLHKPIFIDCYTSWCGPCKWMVKNTFSNDTVGKYFNTRFISAKLDMEKGDGAAIGKAYSVMSYPTYLFLDSTGKILHRFVGLQRPKEFLANAQKALDPESCFGALKKKYKEGNRDYQFIQRYMIAARQAGEPDTWDIYYWYIATLPKDKFVSKENFEIIEKFVYDEKTPGYAEFFDNKEEFSKLVGREKTDRLTVKLLSGAMMRCFNNAPGDLDPQWMLTDETKFLALLNQMRTAGIKDTMGLVSFYIPKYHLAKGNKTAYISTLKRYLPLCCWNDGEGLNTYAWEIFKQSDDKNDLQLALEWSKRSIEIDDNYYHNDTYAALCYKLKNKKDALKYQQKAIKLGQENGEDVNEARARLELIRKME